VYSSTGPGPGSKVRAFQRAAAVVREVGDDELRERAARPARSRSWGRHRRGVTAGRSPRRLGEVPGYLAGSRPRPWWRSGRGRRPCRRRCGATATAHSTWSDGGATVEAMAETARRSATSTWCSPTTRPASPSPTGSTRSGCASPARGDRASSTPSWPRSGILTGIEVDILEDGSLDLSDELLGASTSWWRASTPSCGCPRGDDPAHRPRRRQPPRRRARPLHQPQALRTRPPSAFDADWCSPPAPASAPRSRSTAGPSARTRPRSCSSSPSSGAATSRSTPTPTPRPARVAGLRLRQGVRCGVPHDHRQHVDRPTSSSHGRLRPHP
jgi:hypothetical protein